MIRLAVDDLLIAGNVLFSETKIFLPSSNSTPIQAALTPLHRTQTSFPEDLSDVPNVSRVPGRSPAERNELNRKVIDLIAAAERHDGYADLPPGSIDDEIECELAVYGYAVANSDRLWLGVYRVHSPESILAGNYRPHVTPSIFICASSKFARVLDARDFNLEAVLEVRGVIRSN